MRGVSWHAKVWEEYLSLQTDKTKRNKVNKLIKDLQRNGYRATCGKVELLKGDLSGYASVRIDQKNCLVFQVT